MRQAALAYYSKLPEQQKNLAEDMFLAMAENGDGRISCDEFGDGRISCDEFDHFLEQTGASNSLLTVRSSKP